MADVKVSGRATFDASNGALTITGTFDCAVCRQEIEAYFDTPEMVADKMAAHKEECEA